MKRPSRSGSAGQAPRDRARSRVQASRLVELALHRPQARRDCCRRRPRSRSSGYRPRYSSHRAIASVGRSAAVVERLHVHEGRSLRPRRCLPPAARAPSARSSASDPGSPPASVHVGLALQQPCSGQPAVVAELLEQRDRAIGYGGVFEAEPSGAVNDPEELLLDRRSAASTRRSPIATADSKASSRTGSARSKSPLRMSVAASSVRSSGRLGWSTRKQLDGAGDQACGGRGVPAPDCAAARCRRAARRRASPESPRPLRPDPAPRGSRTPARGGSR